MSIINHRQASFIRILLGFLIAISIGFSVYAIAPNTKPDKPKRINEGDRYKQGEVLVKFKPGVRRHIIDQIADSNQSNVVRNFDAITRMDASEYAHIYSKYKSTEQLMEELQKLPEVAAVSPNHYFKICQTIPNDENFDYLWGLHNTGQFSEYTDIDINAPEAWDVHRGSSSVIVGVIDTGIDYNHPDLIPNMWINPGEIIDGIDNDGNGYVDDIHGINAITSTGDPFDDESHGTHCAGTIGAVGNNSLGVTGVCWDVKLIGTKFIDVSGWGEEADALECMNYILDLKTTYGQNIVAVNASFGGGEYSAVFESAIDAMGAAGIMFCAAAGNDFVNNDAEPFYPSSYTCPNIIAVTAVDYQSWQWFNYGVTSVDIAAPGVDILSTINAVYWPQEGDIFFDDMESGSGKWITGGINNSWAITTDQEIFEWPDNPVPSPPNFWSDSPGVYYLDDTDSWLMNASNIDLTGYVGQDLFIGFGSAMYFEYVPVDHGYMEVSGDGGNTWESIGDFATYAFFWYIPWFYKIPDTVKTSNFRFRFHIVTDYSDTYPGWLIDDVGIGTAEFYGYSYKMGTSMATPHVTGAVALLASMFPSESVAQLKDRILDNTTHLPSLVDICATEGMLDLYAAIMANPAPEMNVRFGSRNIDDGAILDAKSKPVEKIVGREFTFTIENKGNTALNLTGSPDLVYLSGPAANYFQVTQQPISPVPLVSSTTFKIKTKIDTVPPLPVGWEKDVSFDVNIANDDSDEDPYNFTIKIKLVKN
jgi:subtilisin family serine protease